MRDFQKANIMTENTPTFNNEQIDVSFLPDYNDIQPVKIGKKWLKKIRVNAIIFYLILAGGSGIFVWWTGKLTEHPWAVAGGACFFLLSFLLVMYIQYLNWNSMKYAVRMKDLYFEKGWFWNTKIVVPFNRIQHATVVETFMDKNFGIAQLKIYTAGGGSSDLLLPGLTPREANAIRDFILKKVESADEEE